ncbi:MAG TPA: hypothetical protein ENJ43_05375 [Gammaproteobacteria bacterium]|nr:hypothetical protein [Gammaproteobacteria bacterium]
MLKRYPLQAVNYLLFMVLVGYFSTSPAYRHLAEDQAKVVLAFSHFGQHVEPCRRMSPEELAKLPPNMRRPTECTRKRSPVTVELMMDGERLLYTVEKPPGLFDDGGVDIFLDATVPAGEHRFTVRMNDSVRVEGYNYSYEQTATLAPGQLLFIDFNTETGFVFK